MENNNRKDLNLIFEITNLLHSKANITNVGTFIYELCFLRYCNGNLFKRIETSNDISMENIIKEYKNDINNFSLVNSNISNIDVNSSSLELINETLSEMEKYIYSLKDMREIVYLLNKVDDVVIKNIMLLDLFERDNNGVRNGIMNTPEQLCKILNVLLDINKDDSVLDICSSYGNFLTNVGSCCSYKKLTGVEINTTSSLISKIRLTSLGLNNEIITDDLFNVNFNEKFDKILCDYPWGIRFDRITQDYLSHNINRMKFDWKIANGSTDWYFINMLLTLLTDTGKGIVLLPAGPLFKSIDETFRKDIIDNKLVESVIKMPSIRNYTSVEQYAIVFSQNNDFVKFVDISKEVQGDRIYNKSILMNKVFEILNSDKNKNVAIKTIEEIANNGYLLKVDNYVGVKEIKYHNPEKMSEFIIDKYRGYQMSSKEADEIESEDGEYEILTISDIDNGIITGNLKRVSVDDNRFERYLVKEDDIIISSKGTRIKVTVANNIGNRKIVANGNLIVLRVDKEKINPYYLTAYLNSSTGQASLNQIQTGAVIISINPSKLMDMNISTFDMETENKIADKYLMKQKQYLIAKEHLQKLEQDYENYFDDEVLEMF